ncbi:MULTISPECIES: MgtC/SapB family protein [Variovorax]|uniref:Protein MgtC n=1 Tax=Variovorax ginsengisoli TaxID=363844 RepID=A0ABT8S431_9BURK|nr:MULTISPECIES: MgtC/SapB family protein [Variovorax]MDM0079752.1 MgtC/SapB family protein [Variovorax sp. J31P179]MDN8614433.1 MgtC/SapB family protein [Variovorax ginsengisoli]MDO1533603.1 MgtC/SapB family protein [Variovorax ginsengisoli]
MRFIALSIGSGFPRVGWSVREAISLDDRPADEDTTLVRCLHATGGDVFQLGVINSWHGVGMWMVFNMAAALMLGWFVGYERYFSGRAAGSQVYCLVCATSCAVTLLAGYPTMWYWGSETIPIAADPTKVIGAVLTGIGFLGAGLIVKSGHNVRGLTTAASIWGSSAIGILVGVGFYVPAIGLTALFVICTAVVPRIEQRLPAHAAMTGTFRFSKGHKPSPEEVHHFLVKRGLQIPPESVAISFDGTQFEIQCLIFASSSARTSALSTIGDELSQLAHVEGFTLTHSSRA